MAASLPGMFVVASSYLVRGVLLFNPKRVVNSILHTYPMLKTYKKYCNLHNLPNHFIVVFKRLSTCDRCMAHMLWLCRVVAMIEFVLYIYIQSLRMKLSMKNKFPNHILFPAIPTFLEITANQTLFIVGSVLNLFTLGAAHEYRTRKIFKHVIQY